MKTFEKITYCDKRCWLLQYVTHLAHTFTHCAHTHSHTSATRLLSCDPIHWLEPWPSLAWACICVYSNTTTIIISHPCFVCYNFCCLCLPQIIFPSKIVPCHIYNSSFRSLFLCLLTTTTQMKPFVTLMRVGSALLRFQEIFSCKINFALSIISYNWTLVLLQNNTFV